MNTYPFSNTGNNYGQSVVPNIGYYTPQQQTAYVPQQMPAHTEIPKVSGEESIRSFSMAPNSSMIFVSSDPSKDIGWIVTTDAAAYKTIVPCHIIPFQEEQPVKASDVDAKFDNLVKEINELKERMNTYEQHGSKSSKQS